MQDDPKPTEVLASVAAFLRNELLPEVPPHLAFHVRVAANAVDLVRRELELAPSSDAAEAARLRDLLGEDGALADLNASLARRIADGSLATGTPGLAEHLWATTIDKLAVDQPAYSTYRRAVASRGTGTDQ